MTTPAEDPRREPEAPEGKKTTQLPAVPDWAIELTRSVKAGFVAAEERFDKQDVTLLNQGTKLDKVITEGIEANTRMTRFEVRLEDLEGGKVKHSGGIRNLSQSDAGQNMQIASLSVKVDELAGKTDAQTLLLNKLVGLSEKPIVKLVATAIGTAVLTWLTAKGLR